MIISYKHKFIFLKTRKTGSSSIQVALSSICGERDIIVGDERIDSSHNVDRNINSSFSRNPHANLNQVKLAFSKEQWESFFKFSFVRNPWDLVVSRYNWEKKGIDCSIQDFRKWVSFYADEQLASPERNDQSNIVEQVWQKGGGYISDLQSPFVFDGETIGINFIGRYESLEDDFIKLNQAIGIKASPLPHLKAGFRKVAPYREYYDGISRKQIAEAFAKDIEHFGYFF